MDLKQYIQDATTTESLIETVSVDPQLLAGTLQIIIAAGTILDQIKKNVFYDKPYNIDAIQSEFTNMVSSLYDIKEVVVNGISPQETLYSPRIFHSIVGITTEAVELLNGLNDENFDVVNYLEELGDINWYEAIGIDAVDGNFDDVLKTNISKLKSRYPDKFTSNSANNRDLSTERNILEDGLDHNEGC